MLTEPHYPSPKSTIFVFAGIFLLMMGIFAWAFYFNFGTLVLSSDVPFTVSVHGDDIECPRSPCEIALPPKDYQVHAKADQYADLNFEVVIKRWKRFEKQIAFELIPYLVPFSGELPKEETSYRFDQDLNLIDRGGKIVTSFESLQNPILEVRGNTAMVIDNGRLFFVNLQDGSKIRRFDHTVWVEHALLSDDGTKALLMVMKEERKSLWLWNQKIAELQTLDWIENKERIAWDLGRNYRLLVISEDFSDASESSFLGSVLETSPEKRGLGLFLVNLDTGKNKKIVQVEEGSVLHRRNDRFFLENQGAGLQELIVK